MTRSSSTPWHSTRHWKPGRAPVTEQRSLNVCGTGLLKVSLIIYIFNIKQDLLSFEIVRNVHVKACDTGLLKVSEFLFQTDFLKKNATNP